MAYRSAVGDGFAEARIADPLDPIILQAQAFDFVPELFGDLVFRDVPAVPFPQFRNVPSGRESGSGFGGAHGAGSIFHGPSTGAIPRTQERR